MKKSTVLIEAAVIMLALHATREAAEALLRPLAQGTTFGQRMLTMSVMLVQSLAFVAFARARRVPLSVFPAKFGKGYVICTCVAAALLIGTPMNFTGGARAVLLLVYGSVVTPVYEELIFRGYLWNRLNAAFPNEKHTFVWSVALFTLWHLGYMLPHIASGNWSAVGWKLAAGLCYGAVLGLLRLKTKNCYSTMLLHGVLNNFMI